MSDIVIGIFLEILASSSANLAAQTQKIAHKKISIRKQQNSILRRANSSNDIEEIASPFSSTRLSDNYYFLHPLWIFGLMLSGLGSFSSLSAVAFAPQTVIAPVSSITFLINMILTPIMQKERLPRIIVGITMGITCGAILAIIFAPKKAEEPESITEFMSAYRSVNCLIYASFITLILCVLKLAANYYQNKDAAIHRFCYPAFVGIFGAQNLLIGKGVSKSILLSFKGKGSCYLHWEWYALTVALIVICVFFLRWYNRGLKKFSPLQFVAIQTAFWMFTVIIGGLAVFNEMDSFKNVSSIVMFTMGTAISILFMFCLSGVEPQQITPVVIIEEDDSIRMSEFEPVDSLEMEQFSPSMA